LSQPVIVAHHYWGPGGETAFNIELARSLCSLGYRVRIASSTRPPRPVLEGLAGCTERAASTIPIGMPVLAVYQRLLLSPAIRRVLPGSRLLWVDAPTYKPVVGRARRLGIPIIEYIHFPLELLRPEARSRLPGRLRWEVEEYFSKYTRSWAWRLYMAGYRLLEKTVYRGDPWEAASIVAANSRYTALMAWHLWGREPRVLYPPVDTRLFSRGGGRGYGERRNEVVVLGRVSPEKRIETVIDAAARAASKPRVVVAGAVSPGYRGYLERLRGRASGLGVELVVLENPSYREMAEAAWGARVYVHAAVGEHFGITVVEAMAAGLPVVVHRSGGPYHDIVERGRWGLHFDSLEELVDALDLVLGSEREWARWHGLSRERAGHFSREVFAEGVARLVGEVLGTD